MDKPKIMALLICLGCPWQSSAQVMQTTGDLYQTCKDADFERLGDLSAAACGYYMAGATEAIVIAGQLGSHRSYCLPSTIFPKQAAAVFVKWAEKNPEQWHYPRAAGLFNALSEAFPCSPRQN
ncbi:Rap1a/Tai family immunity protein [Stenotrophomonas acidaminiphila]